MSKRRRRTKTGVKRPIDKKLITITQGTALTTQVQTLLYTATYPATVGGLRWELGLDASGGDNALAWAIVLVRDGGNPATLSHTNGGSLYVPEQNTIAFGRTFVGQDTIHIEGSTKSMRKLMDGDQIFLIVKAKNALQWYVDGAVQFFMKS